MNKFKFKARASRTGINFEVRLRDSEEKWITKIVNIKQANTWQTIECLITTVSNIDKDAIESPCLPDIEVLSEVEKARVDLGMENFRKKEIAMPDIVRRVRDEARRRLCSVPKNLYSYYLQRLEDFENET